MHIWSSLNISGCTMGTIIITIICHLSWNQLVETSFPEESDQVFDQWSSQMQKSRSIGRHFHFPSDLILSQNAIPWDFRRFSDANIYPYTQQLSSIQLRTWNVTIEPQIRNDRWSKFGYKQQATETEVLNDFL